MSRKMHLMAYMKTGATAMHAGGWRHPESTLEDIFDPVRYEQTAQLLEAAKFDGAFFADAFGVIDTYKGFDEYLRWGGQNSYLDPVIVLPLMARVTKHLGLAATVSTTFHNAYQLARVLASVDQLSAGRVGWNVVTSSSNMEAKNAGLTEILPHDERYDRADEVLEACFALWESWAPDALILDKATGQFADPEKVHYVNYEGKWTRTRGPLGTPPSPQGHPVIIQAGSSERGRNFAARWAEAVFAPHRGTREFCEDMRERLAAAGRDPASCKMLPGVTPIIGETESIAQERAAFFDSLQDPEYDLAWASFSAGADLSKHRTLEEISAVRGNQGTRGMDEGVTQATAAGEATTKALVDAENDDRLIGTPEIVADGLQELFETDGCDGFIIMPTAFPTSHEQFCRAVVPELQRRGLFRTEYSATTLRGNLSD